MKKVNDTELGSDKDTIALLRSLIEIESLSGQENTLREYIYKWLIKEKVPTFIQDENIVVGFEYDNSAALIFNAHMDTVSAGNISNWQYPPVGAGSGIKKGKKIYGLGSSDDKAGLVTLMLLAKQLTKAKAPCDVWIVFVVKEEVDGSGTKSFLNWLKEEGHLSKYKSLSAVLLEPTGLSSMELGHRGNVFIKLTTTGDSGHSSQPAKIKTNSVLEMMKVFEQMKKLEKSWIEKYSHPLLGSPSIGIGTSIQAGSEETPNKFPSICTATLDIRTTPLLHSVALDEIKESLKEFKVSVQPLFTPAPYGLTEKNTDIIHNIQKFVPYPIKLGISWGSTDQCFFTEKGIPAIVFGPGEKSTMHKPNEYCYFNKINKCASLFLSLVSSWNSE